MLNTKLQCRSNCQVLQALYSTSTYVLAKYRVYLILAWHLLDSCDLPALGVLAPCGAGVDHGVVLELVRRVEDAAAVVRAHHRELAVLQAGARFNRNVEFIGGKFWDTFWDTFWDNFSIMAPQT